MAKSLLNTLFAIMLTALFWGCGRSSSNDRPSGGEQMSDSEAIESIEANEVEFDECTLDEYAHSISRGEDFDDVQLAYMVMHCKATAKHLEDIVLSLQHNDDAADSYNVLLELEQSRWLDGYRYILKYLKTVSLPSDLDDILNNVFLTNEKIVKQVKALEQQQHLDNFNLNL
jgi:hypothetical protein